MNSFNPNMMGQMNQQAPNQFQTNFNANPNQIRPNSQQHVSSMLQSVAKPTMVPNQQGGMPNQMNQMPPMNQMQMSRMNMGGMNMMPNQIQMNPSMMHRPNQVYPPQMGMNQIGQNMRQMTPMPNRMAMPNGNHDGSMMVQPNQQIGNPNQQQMPNPNQQNQITNQANGPATQDPEKRKMIQNQLIILIHAAKCTKRNDAQGTQCQIPHCQTMKNVLEHLPSCQMAKNCPVQHCSSSRHIIAHWKQCKNQQCQVCQPLKHPNPNDPNKANVPNAGPGQTGPDQVQRPSAVDQQGQQPPTGIFISVLRNFYC
ncbi:unnamed protein product [Oikopleura dioica]|uniref:histone acetyltransferase n=1 Tax=Oikopleura dioica TaxID=34765 RepID=E4Y1K5_OIKDI|nr:unnamed protein product [Oikopleura dioica]